MTHSYIHDEHQMSLIDGGTLRGARRNITSLPDDILREVFDLSVHGFSVVPEYDTPVQYILGTVCRRWRDLALHTPLLWSDIYIPMKEPYDSLAFFERSAPALIDVSFSSVWSSDMELHNRVSKAILKNISRLRKLNIDVLNLDELTSLFVAWRDKEAPNFRQLNIVCHDTFIGIKELDATFLSYGESLRSVKLAGLEFNALPFLPNLTTLEIDRMRPEPPNLQALFDHCPALESLTVGQFGAPPPSDDTGAPRVQSTLEIVAPSLKSLALNLDCDHTEECECALPHLVAENLEYLEISQYDLTFADLQFSITSHFRELPRLQKLRIRNHLFSDSDVAFFSSLPKTTNLEIMGFPNHRDPGAGLSILNMPNFQSIAIDLTAFSISRESDVIKLHNVLQANRPTLRCPVNICCDADNETIAFWKSLLGERLIIQPMPLQSGLLDNYLFSCDDMIDRMSGSTAEEYDEQDYEWDEDEWYDEDGDFDDGSDYFEDEEENEDDIHI